MLTKYYRRMLLLHYPGLPGQECAEKCVADFDHAIPLLPVDWDQTTAGRATLGLNDTRINKIMALAYKGRHCFGRVVR